MLKNAHAIHFTSNVRYICISNFASSLIYSIIELLCAADRIRIPFILSMCKSSRQYIKSCGLPNKSTFVLWWSIHCKKNSQNSCIFFTKPFRNGKTPMLTRDFLVPSREGIFVFWGGKSIALFAGVIFSSLFNVIFPYFPYFPIKFTGKLMWDSRLATGAPGRVAIKFCRREKNLAPFVKLQVWNQWKF